MSISLNCTQTSTLAEAVRVYWTDTDAAKYPASALVLRALGRWEREFAAYQSGTSRLVMVRKYHSLLIDALSAFAGDDDQ